MLFELADHILENKSRILVIGDLHGDYASFQSALKQADLAEDFLIFLGDYADRGDKGVEIIESLHNYMVKYPQSVLALKGNHEIYSPGGKPQFHPCDLIDEAETKRGGWLHFFNDEFKPFITKLYLAAVIPGKALFVHGGITSEVRSLHDLSMPSKSLEKDLLWSDAVNDNIYESLNILRGTGKLFGKSLTEEVCKNTGVGKIFRSHEPRKALKGPFYQHDDRFITISSTSVYGGAPHMLSLEKDTMKGETIYL